MATAARGVRGQRPAAVLLGAALLLLLSTCGGGAPPVVNNCPDDAPNVCPEVAPSYATEVEPLLHDRCGGCHTVDGLAAVYPFDTYQEVQEQRRDIQFQLLKCMMPPADQLQPTSAERQTILAWLVCGAMKN